MPMDLTQAIALIKSGGIDAQENPLSNTVTYGVHKFHHFHSLTNHFYVSRPIFVNRTAFDAWPNDLKNTMQSAIKEAIAFQRELHVQEEKDARETIAAQGCEVSELTMEEHEQFASIVRPLRDEAAHALGADLLSLAES
jgi:TRAP-type transport system periplasmic protein